MPHVPLFCSYRILILSLHDQSHATWNIFVRLILVPSHEEETLRAKGKGQ